MDIKINFIINYYIFNNSIEGDCLLSINIK